MKKKLFITFFAWFLLPLFIITNSGLCRDRLPPPDNEKEILALGVPNELGNDSPLVVAIKRIPLIEYPKAFNPSIVKFNSNFLLSFRYLPDLTQPWISFIGVMLLDEDLEAISPPQLLNTRDDSSLTPSQAEDARLFACQDQVYVIYNDNLEVVNPSAQCRRDMYIAKLSYSEGQFSLSTPLKLYHEKKYPIHLWQKNWIPFEWNEKTLFSYSIIPHEVLSCDLLGKCQPIYETESMISWKWGVLRGGTPASLVNGEYLAFFHSSIPTRTASSKGKKMWHYYMGAYTFSSAPPFELKKISALPIIAKGFYTASDYEKRVIFPGGFVVADSLIHVAYGKDDSEVWIATIDKDRLMESLQPVRTKPVK